MLPIGGGLERDASSNPDSPGGGCVCQVAGGDRGGDCGGGSKAEEVTEEAQSSVGGDYGKDSSSFFLTVLFLLSFKPVRS